MLSGVIFDFDGVLVDREVAHFEAFRRVLAAEVEAKSPRPSMTSITRVVTGFVKQGTPEATGRFYASTHG